MSSQEFSSYFFLTTLIFMFATAFLPTQRGISIFSSAAYASGLLSDTYTQKLPLCIGKSPFPFVTSYDFKSMLSLAPSETISCFITPTPLLSQLRTVKLLRRDVQTSQPTNFPAGTSAVSQSDSKVSVEPSEAVTLSPGLMSAVIIPSQTNSLSHIYPLE